MNRREFFKMPAAKRTVKKYVRQYQTTVTGLQPYSGEWSFDEAAHLLRRTTFGASRQHIDYALTSSVSNVVDELLIQSAHPAPPVREYGLVAMENGMMYDDPNVAKGATWVNDLNKIEDGNVRGAIFNNRCQSLRKWWTGVMLNHNFSITEKMVLFWHHHYSIQKEEVEHPILLYRHLNLLRTHALGNVRELAKKVTTDAAMLIHLNGYLNTKVAPDENYARELQELFTVGKGEDSQYTEEDVMAAARALTGWRVNQDTCEVTLEAQGHDTGNKTFSAFYNNTAITGSADAQAEVDALVNMIFSTTESARFICRKIYRWFVNSNIDADTETNVIIPLAEIFRANNFEVKPVLEVLLKSEHFFDPANRACYIKSPFDLMIGALREFNVAVPAYTNYEMGYPLFQSVYQSGAVMGMDLLQPPDVNGWPAYHQDPLFYEMWVNSNSLPQRADFTDGLFNDNVVDVRAMASQCSDPADPDKLIDEITKYLLKYPLSDASKLYIKNNFIVTDPGNPSEWAAAWNSNNLGVIVPRLKNMLKFVCNLPEYHLC